jgi:AcrR family transcriptional regulator
MLNSVTEEKRTRLSPEDRRRQLIGIGLRMLVEKPIQDLPLDAVAAEAGISRGLLFHYFPTKTDYYDAVIGAALRRVVRNISPDEDAVGDQALHQFVDRFYAQIERRRAFYLALVFGNGALTLGGEGVDTHRMSIARRVVTATGLPEDALTITHGWTAYVEDRALRWTALPDGSRPDRAAELNHACQALHALLAIRA